MSDQDPGCGTRVLWVLVFMLLLAGMFSLVWELTL